MKRGKEAAVINQLEWYMIKKIKALGRWVANHDEYSLSLMFWYLDYHLPVHECQTCKRHTFSWRDTAGSAQLMARALKLGPLSPRKGLKQNNHSMETSIPDTDIDTIIERLLEGFYYPVLTHSL
jgi:hypothetical protein